MAAALSEGKKRALEALERRFAVAKAHHNKEEHQSSKKIKRTLKEDSTAKVRRKKDETSIAPPPEINPSSSKDGHAALSGYNLKRDASATSDVDVHPVYSQLSQIVNENLIGPDTQVSNKGDTVNKIVFNILRSGDKGHKYAKGSISMKIDNCLLLDNFVPRGGSSTDARVKALQSHSKRSKKHMSLRQHRKCGSFDMPKEFHDFNLFKPMHEMWKEYIIELLKEVGKKQLPQCLLMADLHGAFIRVVECKTTAYKGFSGIMIRETAETFGIISQDNRFRVVPKGGSIFLVQAGYWKVTLFGDKLSLRNKAH